MNSVLSLVNKRPSGKKETIRFLDLPPELRNVVYSFVFEDVEEEVAFPIMRKRKSTREKITYKLTPHSKRTSALSLLLTNKQIRAEAFKYVFSVCHGELYSPRESLKKNLRLMFDNVFHDFTARQLNRSMKIAGPNMNYITQLDIRGHLAIVLVLQPDDAQKLRKRMLSKSRYQQAVARMTTANYKLRELLCNVEKISVFLEDSYYDEFRKVLSWKEISAHLIETFPKLGTVTFCIEYRCEIVWERPALGALMESEVRNNEC